MPPNFDQSLVLENGRIYPRGTLDLESDEEIVRLYVWVIQPHDDGTSAACIGHQFQGGFESTERWKTREDAIHEGEFRPGQALAMAVSISKVVSRGGVPPSRIYSPLGTPVDGSTRVYQWCETVVLAEGRGEVVNAGSDLR
jgi:hypothetical protein